MDGATLETHFSQADWDLVCQSLPSPTPVRSQLPISTDLWLRILHDLTADRQPHRALPLVEEQPAAEQSATELDVTSSSVHLPASTLIVPQQLLPYVSKYNFETCRSTYFEFSSEPSTTQKGQITPSKYQKGLTCDFPPDYKCKVSPFPVVTTCEKFPAHSLCARCGSIGDHTMIHCLGCCQAYHAFCAHLPESLVSSLTSWYCHRCAECRHCHEKEVFGKKFASDIIETCHRCHSQYHVHCEKTNHFLAICGDSPKQRKVCQRCFFQSTCRSCKGRISGEDVLRECIGLNGETCSVCRNVEEKDLCRECLKIFHGEELRMIVCDICKDSTHMKCLRDTDLHRLSLSAGRFVCCDCQRNVISMKKEELWTEKSAAQILDRLRNDVLLYINETVGKLEASRGALPNEAVDSPPSSELDCEQLSSDSGFQSMGDSEGLPGFSREPSATANVSSEGIPAETRSRQRSRLSSSSVAVQTVPLESPARPSSGLRDDTSAVISSLTSTYTIPPDPVFFLDGKMASFQPEALQSAVLDFGSVVEELSSLLREFLFIGNEKKICLWPKNFLQTVETTLGRKQMPETLLKTLRSHFGEMYQRVTLPKEDVFEARNKKMQLPPVRKIFPIVHRGEEPMMLLKVTSEQSSTAEERRKSITADQRLCMYCTVAGDDNVGYGGRILSVGYDLWAHIGCLNYVATKKRYFDYTVFKVINIDSLRKNECASCPVRMGVITCASNNCRNAYHFNCAVNEKCSLTVANGVICPIHKHQVDEMKDIRVLRANELEESFSEFPVFVKAPPSNIRSVGNCDWTSGIRKEDVKVHVGGVHVEQLGRLVRGWDTQDTLLPCGYKMHRLFWSTKDPRLLTRYTFFTVDMNAQLVMKTLICSILEREDIPDFEALEKFKSVQEAARCQTGDAADAEVDDLPTFEIVPPAPEPQLEETPGDVPSVKELSVKQEAPMPLKPVLHKAPVVKPPSPKPTEEVSVDSSDPAVEVFLDSEMPAEVPVNVMYGMDPDQASFVEIFCGDDFDLPEELPPPISHENDTAVRKNSLDLKQVIQKAKEKELERQSYSPEIFGPPIHHKRPGAPPTPLDVISNIPGKRRRRAETPFTESPAPSQDAKRPKLNSGKRDRASHEPLHRSNSMADSVMTNEAVSRGSADSAWSGSTNLPEPVLTLGRRMLRSSRRLSAENPTKEMDDDCLSTAESSPDEYVILPPNLVKRPSTRASFTRPSFSSNKRIHEDKIEIIKKINSKKKKEIPARKISKNVKSLSMPARRPTEVNLSISAKQKVSLPKGKKKGEVMSSVMSLKYVPAVKSGNVRSSTRQAALAKPVLPSVVSSPEIAPPKTLPKQRKEEPCFSVQKQVGEKAVEETRPEKARKEVRFDSTVGESQFVPSFDEIQGYVTENGRLQMESGPYCCPAVYDPEPQAFSEVKRRGRDEVEKRRKRRVLHLLDMLKTTDLSVISKTPSQLCVLVAEDGFLVASHSPEDVVTHLYAQLEKSRTAFGLHLPTPFGKPIVMDPLEFVALSYNVVRFMLEQLTIPASASNVYERKYFSKDVLKGRSKGELDSFRMTLFDRGPTCSTCPLPFFCFHIYEGRTYSRVPLHERQVVMKWNVPYDPLEQNATSPSMYRIRDTIQVDPANFPDFYEDIRHRNRQTCVMVYAVHQEHNVVSLALVSKSAFAAGTEIKFDAKRLPRPIESVIGVTDFSCAQHGRDK